MAEKDEQADAEEPAAGDRRIGGIEMADLQPQGMSFEKTDTRQTAARVLTVKAQPSRASARAKKGRFTRRNSVEKSKRVA